MHQTKWDSLVETVIGTAIGFVISYFISLATSPLWNMMPKALAGFVITSIFTVASLIRSYHVRRWFNSTPVGHNVLQWIEAHYPVLLKLLPKRDEAKP